MRESVKAPMPYPAVPESTAIGKSEVDQTERRRDFTGILARLRRRFLDVYHHRPQRLWVAVNGIPVGSMQIASRKNELRVSTEIAEPLQFVEVFSEQNIRLALLNADPSDDAFVEPRAKISLSDRRRMRLSWKERRGRISIHLAYTDPEIEGWEILEALGLCCAVAPA